MKKQIVTLAAACLLALPLTACGTSTSSSSTTTSGSSSSVVTSSAASSTAASDFDAAAYFEGQWRGSVKTTGESVYGTVGGTEQMLDVYINEDGTCSVEPLEAHADLLTAEGTWEATDESAITLTVNGEEIVLTTVDSTTLEGDPTCFDIDGFDIITFVLY